jgi:hypothetical protein
VLWAGALVLLLAAAAVVLSLDRGAAPAEITADDVPLVFTQNRGEADPGVRFYGQAPGFGVYLERTGLILALARGEQAETLRLHFAGANPHPRVQALGAPGAHVTQIRAGHRARSAVFDSVVYRDLWPGTDFVVKGGRGHLEYEFRLAPGARADAIRLAYGGARSLAVTRAGELAIRTDAGTLRDSAPKTFQVSSAGKTHVASAFKLLGPATYGFSVGRHDPRKPLVIDPDLVYSTFVGGNDDGSYGPEGAHGVTVDAAGNAYVAGFTPAPDFPTTPGAYSRTLKGGIDAFVTKLNADGSGIVWSTLLGGSTSGDAIGPIAVQPDGTVVVLGGTDASDFPTTPGAYDRTFNGESDGFVAKLSADGSQLLYSTYLGGNWTDNPAGLAIDSAGQVVVSGLTASTDYPTTPGAYDRTLDDGVSTQFDGFVTKLSADGSSLVYSTFVGGTGGDWTRGLQLDPEGNAYFTGYTDSDDYPTTPGAFQRTPSGSYFDVFVTKLNADGTGLVYSTLLGQTLTGTFVFAIDVDEAGHAYVTGTGSPDFPVTPGAPADGLGFVTELNETGSGLVYSRRIQADGHAIAVDATGRAFVAGYTRDPAFPTTPDAYDPTFNGELEDAFLMELDPSGQTIYATVLGGATPRFPDFPFERVFALALDQAGGVYLAGFTEEPSFPTTPGAFDRTFGGTSRAADGFAAKFQFAQAPPESTPGCKVTGNGQIVDAAGDRALFQVTARASSSHVRGHVFYRLRGPDRRFSLRSIDLSALVCDGDRGAAALYGRAQAGRDQVDFRVDVTDGGRRGAGDTFRIRLGNGYDSGTQPVIRGDVKARTR